MFWPSSLYKNDGIEDQDFKIYFIDNPSQMHNKTFLFHITWKMMEIASQFRNLKLFMMKSWISCLGRQADDVKSARLRKSRCLQTWVRCACSEWWSCNDWNRHRCRYIVTSLAVSVLRGCQQRQQYVICLVLCAIIRERFLGCWTTDKRLSQRKIVYYWFEDAECDYDNQNMIWIVVGGLWTVIWQISCTTMAGTWFDWWLFKNWTRWWWFFFWTSRQNY